MSERLTTRAVATAAFLAGAAAGGVGGRASAPDAPADDPQGGWRYADTPRQVCLEGHAPAAVNVAVRPEVVTRDGTLVSVPELRATVSAQPCYDEALSAASAQPGAQVCFRRGADLPPEQGPIEATRDGVFAVALPAFPPCAVELFDAALASNPLVQP